MTDIKGQLDALKKRLDTLESDRATSKAHVEEATRALEGQQAELDRLSAEHEAVIADLEATMKLNSELDDVAHALDNARKLGEDELSKGRDELAALKSRVEQELSDARRAALLRDVKAIDDAISAATSESDKAATALAEAETKQTRARDEAAAAAQKYDDTLRRLQAAPQGIEAARARIVALRSAAVSAVDAGRMAEGFVRARDLELALATLEAALKPEATAKLSGELPDLWQDKLAKADTLAGATKEVGPLQAQVATARQHRDSLVAGRDQQIVGVLKDTPHKPDAPQSPSEEEHPDGDPSAPPTDDNHDSTTDPAAPPQ